MTTDRRIHVYWAQLGRKTLTPAQRRRINKKAWREAGAGQPTPSQARP